MNPAPQLENNVFNFMSWNINSLSKKEFERVRLIEAHNSIFNYDLISICETSLDHSSELKVPELKGCTFLPTSHPDNVTHGGVGTSHPDNVTHGGVGTSHPDNVTHGGVGTSHPDNVTHGGVGTSHPDNVTHGGVM